MITNIDFKNIKDSKAFSYAQKLEFFQKNQSLDFKPGLNIIFAPNGTGKSTILKILGKFTASEQGGVSTITNDWIRSIEDLKGLSVSHDGQPVMYNNPRDAVGLIGGMAGFDDDFFEKGFMETQLRESTGMTTLHRIGGVLKTLNGDIPFPDKIEDKSFKNEKALKFLKANLPQGQKTILLDEPESGLAIHIQANMWRMISKTAKDKDFQIIVATHSPFCLIYKANFIELQPGYMNMAKDYVADLGLCLDAFNKLKKIDEKNKSEPKKKKV